VEGEVLHSAEAIDSAEQRIRAAVLEGTRLDEARRANQYHALQTRVRK
jgi:4-hydroxy-4-methyl-2-oxoglutarate aldolase